MRTARPMTMHCLTVRIQSLSEKNFDKKVSGTVAIRQRFLCCFTALVTAGGRCFAAVERQNFWGCYVVNALLCGVLTDFDAQRGCFEAIFLLKYLLKSSEFVLKSVAKREKVCYNLTK